MISIIDYGMGNLRSVQKAFESIGAEAEITSDAENINRAGGVVLPGVGAFKDAIDRLNATGLADVIKEQIRAERPFLGICLGLQLLFEESEEDGIHQGLAVVKGSVKRLPGGVKIPHMGWNEAEKTSIESPCLDGIADRNRFYFVHSYYVEPADSNIICTSTDYGIKFTSSIAFNNLFACQFHPEKSGDTGLKLLKNFVNSIK